MGSSGTLSVNTITMAQISEDLLEREWETYNGLRYFLKNKELLLQTGHLNNKTNTEAETFLGGKDKIIEDVVNEIEVQIENEKDSTTD